MWWQNERRQGVERVHKTEPFLCPGRVPGGWLPGQRRAMEGPSGSSRRLFPKGPPAWYRKKQP
ncbi:hypothetical protein DPMN_016390 [Dreissena polymorpha]|uniref:Uncharacterized protein n=1 Tax=Dreissena polymorpha TaxID=45954 RepID=A0A9D4S6E0_DREPO|nr:hypothetical protein DPMN_016390 [Dreissena polymorpha]